MLVKIADFARSHGISSLEFEEFLKKSRPDLLQVISGTFGIREDAVDDKDAKLILEAFQNYAEEEEEKRLDRMGVYGETIRKKYEEEKAQRREEQLKEEQKIEFAESFDEFYEYSIVTILNKHGRLDTEKYVEVLNEKAKDGWRLRTVHTNELGKEAIRILGFGVNSTVSEDALIFERRIRKGMERSKASEAL